MHSHRINNNFINKDYVLILVVMEDALARYDKAVFKSVLIES